MIYLIFKKIILILLMTSSFLANAAYVTIVNEYESNVIVYTYCKGTEGNKIGWKKYTLSSGDDIRIPNVGKDDLSVSEIEFVTAQFHIPLAYTIGYLLSLELGGRRVVDVDKILEKNYKIDSYSVPVYLRKAKENNGISYTII